MGDKINMKSMRMSMRQIKNEKEDENKKENVEENENNIQKSALPTYVEIEVVAQISHRMAI